jgi:glycosyltransferase involved in cell wall biosynthesis
VGWLQENNMHILLIHQAFAALNEPGGTRHYELAHYLVEKGHRVTVIASPISYLTGKSYSQHILRGIKKVEDGITIYRAYTYPALHRSFFHRLFSFLSFMISSFFTSLQVEDIDLVWGTSPPIFQGLTAWLVARLKQKKFLFEVRDLWPDFAIAVGVLRQPLLIWASRGLEKFLYRHADRVLVNSPGFINHVRERGARTIDLVPNGADPRMFDPTLDGLSFRKEHRLDSKFVVLYAGAHGLSNDLATILEAARLLLDRSDIALVLLGDGKDKPALVQRAQELNLSNLLFIPPLPKSQIPAALAAADACIAILKPIPLFTTVYPNKVFDYMAAGKPVILAIKGIIREVIESVQAGIPVEPGEAAGIAQAINQLADHPESGKEMGQRGRHYVETHFDRAVLAGKLEHILMEIIKKP